MLKGSTCARDRQTIVIEGMKDVPCASGERAGKRCERRVERRVVISGEQIRAGAIDRYQTAEGCRPDDDRRWSRLNRTDEDER